MGSLREFSFSGDSMGKRKAGAQSVLTNWFPQPIHQNHVQGGGQGAKGGKGLVRGNED